MKNNTFIPAATLVLLSTAFLPAIAAAAPALLVRSESRPISRLFVGDHLEVGLSGAAPSTSYGVSLRDEDGALVESFSLTTDAAGTAAPRRFWTFSGVVGCDLSSDPYPAEYRFQHFADAETALAGRTFTLAAVDSDAITVATLPLPMVASPGEMPYFSNAAGCLRYYFKDDEPVYVALRRPNRNLPSRKIFLTAPGSSPVGSQLTDVRGLGGVQTWTLPPTGNLVVVQVLSAAASQPGAYSGTFRWEDTLEPIELPGDKPLHLSGHLPDDGIFISTDGCPTCDRP